MRDGRTVKRERSAKQESFAEFSERWQASLVLVSGIAAGTEFPIDRPRVCLGRGPGIDLAFDDTEMSRQHAAIEFSGGGFRLIDLGSTNGTVLNEATLGAGELKNGDRLRLGRHVFQFVLEERRTRSRAYVVPGE